MKKLFFLLAMVAGIATSCATVSVGSEPPMYLTGRDEPAASSNFSAPPMYYTGNDEPAAFGLFISEQ
jgi:hypothetical protein